MRRTVKHLVCMGVCATILMACTAEQQSQGLGALLGAAGGAAVGALAGKGDTTAILAGAAAGALVGWAAVKLTQYHAEKTASAQQETKVLGYKSSDGTVVKIRDSTTTPDQITAGQTVALSTNYTVLAPDPNASVPVTETIQLWKDNKMVQELRKKVEAREPGGWTAKANIPVPKDAPAGTYVVKTQIDGGGSNDERETHFVVAS